MSHLLSQIGNAVLLISGVYWIVKAHERESFLALMLGVVMLIEFASSITPATS